jgi:hypothetical protein
VDSHRVRLKCWRGHADLSGGAPGHPSINDLNQSFEVRYDARRENWSLSKVIREACPCSSRSVSGVSA